MSIQPKEAWQTYAIPPIAASAAIIPVFRDLLAKSDLQRGKPIAHITFLEGVRQGVKAVPTVGMLVGSQMIIQNRVEKILVGESNQASFFTMLASSAVVGVATAPILAIFNGQTMKWGVWESLRKFSPKQGMAITAQETAFVCGLSAADRLAAIMKSRFGDNKAVEYAAAFMAGAAGSLAGHPANTALTRWQSGMDVNVNQLMWGSMRKARAIGFFSVIYKLGKETLNK